MRKLLMLLLPAALGAGWLFFQKFEIEGMQDVAIKPRTASQEVGGGPPVERTGQTIRIASFNIQVFGDSKLGKPHVAKVLAEAVRRFDLVAIQEIRSKNEQLLPQFVDMVNADGRHYDYAIGPRLGRSNSKEQYAFVFDTASIEIDRSALYTVEDQDDLLHREPLVGWFRVRGPPAGEAFTFSLINIHTDPDETDTELDALDDVFRAVRNDGRGEDDVILLGDLNVDDEHLGQLGEVSGISWVISGMPTNTRKTKLYDNIVYSRPATAEFTGRAGVFDLMREFNLTMDQALEVSDHQPIFAEFSVYEGGQPGRVASQPEGSAR